MKLIMKRLFVIFMAFAIFSCSLFTESSSNSVKTEVGGSRNLPNSETIVDGKKVKLLPSKKPPKTNEGVEIPVSKAPLFVTFGWDDNAYADGMDWTVELAASKTNPAGSGQARTYDGAPVTFSYFHIGSNKNFTGAIDSWKRAYDAGHEIGNHTFSHNSSRSYTTSQWNTAIDQCNDVLTAASPQGVGASLSEIYGFRTPRLEYNDALFNSLYERKMYDCSIVEGSEYDQDGTNHFWPYTLDEGSPGHDIYVEWGMQQPISPRPGLWEMPVYIVTAPPSIRQNLIGRVGQGDKDYFDPKTGKITGFDYNLWALYKMSKAEVVATLKHTLDLRLKGNRAPMLVGTHTDMYSSRYGHAMAAPLADRRAAIEEFLAYALTKSVVRVVSQKQILDWIKDPVPLQGLATYTVTPSAGANGSIEPATPVDVEDCSSYTFKIKPDAGYMIDTVKVGGKVVDYDMDSVTVGPVSAATTVEVTFREVKAEELFQGTYYWTYNYKDEPVDMETPMVDMLDLNNNVLATVPEALAKRIAMEGSGFVPDGRLLNLSNSYDWPNARFMVCDPDVAPWGYNAKGEPLVPYKTLAVDPEVIPLGSDVYVKEFDGLRVPDGKGGYFIHDGWWQATDTSHSFGGFQIDFFVVTQPNYVEVNKLLNDLSVFQVYCENQVPTESFYITATTNRSGALWPSGEIRVAKGKGEKFYFFPGGENNIKEVLVNGQAVQYNTEKNTVMVENVIANTTLHLVIESPLATVTTSVINGTITPTVEAEQGTDVVIEFSPNPGDFILEYVKIDGKIDPDATSPYTFVSVGESHSIEVKYKRNGPIPTYTIETSKTGNGTIDQTVDVEENANKIINFEAALGHFVESVFVNGDKLNPTPAGSYEFVNVTANQTIVVNFAEVTETLTAEYKKGADWGSGFGANVVITNNGTEPVNGWTVTMTFSGNQTVSGWSGNFSQNGKVVTVTNVGWNGTIQPGATATFGMNGSYSGTNEDPIITVSSN